MTRIWITIGGVKTVDFFRAALLTAITLFASGCKQELVEKQSLNDITRQQTVLASNNASASLDVVRDAQGSEPYARRSELRCADVTVILATHCLDDSFRAYPTCQKQEFEFHNQTTGVIKRIEGSGKSAVEAKSRIESLDGLGGSWTCERGKDSSLLVVGYFNGGNCEQCEWYEIYSLDGKRLTPNARNDGRSFSKTADKLGLPNNWRSRLVQIPLTRGTKK